jgi:hypothetical protein
MLEASSGLSWGQSLLGSVPLSRIAHRILICTVIFVRPFLEEITMAPCPRPARSRRTVRARISGNRANLRIEQLESRQLLNNGGNLGSIAGLTDTPSERFLTQLYYDLLQRVPSAAEVGGWVKVLNAGVAPSALPPYFTSSAEYQTNVIQEDYYSILQRQPSAAEVQAWLNLAQTGTSDEQIKVDFLSSGEFYQKAGGTAAGWLNGVYEEVLGRGLDSYGLAAWTSLLQSGVPRTAVARDIVISGEADGIFIASTYQELLNRSASSAEINAWVGVFSSGLTQEQFVADVAGSSEYYQQATGAPSAVPQSPPKNSPMAPGGGALLVSGFPSPTTAGVAGSFTVTAFDIMGHVNTGYTGTVHFTSSDAHAVLPANYTFTSSDAGSHTFSATLNTAGTQSLTATDINTGITGSQTGITVDPVTASSLLVSDFPSPATAGVAGSFTVTALDSSGHVDTGYTGTVHFTSSDAHAVLPANYTFTASDQGVHTFTATLKTALTQSLTATDTSTGSITGSQTGITVNPAAASRFIVSGFPSPTTAGVAHSFTVTAEDAYGNTTTGYRGTVHFTSSDAHPVLPANYTFTASDQGVHTFTATLKTALTQSLTATDTSTGSITGSQTGITVNPAAASRFIVSGFPSPTQVRRRWYRAGSGWPP